MLRRMIPTETVLVLSPGPGNPGNRRTAFHDENDGGMRLVYSRFYGEYDAANDHSTAYIAARCSRDDGATWTDEDEVVLPNEAAMNTVSTSVMDRPDGTVGLFYSRKQSLADCRPMVRFSRDWRSWSEPVSIIEDETAYYVVNNDRVVRLSNGRLLVPVARHGLPGEEFHSRGVVMCCLSDDEGERWHRSETVLEQHLLPDCPRGLQEPGVVELRGGRLLMFCRGGGGTQYLSHSQDGGETWTPVERSSFSSPCSPASVKRVPETGDLLLVYNDNGADDRRTPLTAGLSSDEGRTWRVVGNLEEDPEGHYCYVSIHFRAGHVLLGYSAGRRGAGGLNESKIVRFPVERLYS